MPADEPPAAGSGVHLLLNSPLASASLDELLVCATDHGPARIVDYGCGWGEPLLRALERSPGAHGVGVDLYGPDLERGRRAAEERGLRERVEFIQGPVEEHRHPAELMISLGAYQGFGGIDEALAAFRAEAPSGARVLFGCEYWRSTPSETELSHMWPDAAQTDCLDLPDLIEHVHRSGWRVIDLHDTTTTEFDAYEVGHLKERELWLADRPGHPLATELDQAWTSWLRGHRRSMGFLSLVLT